MLTGRSIQAIEAEIARQLTTKRDFIVPTSFLAFTVGAQLLNKSSGKSLPLTRHAHRQIAAHLEIPHGYYERMLERHPDLLAANVNRWLEGQAAGTRRLVRVLDGTCRSYLSDKYLPLDHHDVLRFLLPAIREAGCEIVSAELTDTRLYVKALCPRTTGEVKVGDRVQAGVLIQNSEIGQGRVEVSPLVYRLACKNGMVIQELANRRMHVGRRASDNDIDASGIYSRQTIMTDIAAFLMKARDSVKAALDEAFFGKLVDKLRFAAGEKVENVPEAIEEVTDRYSLSDDEGAAVLKAMIEGGDSSRWGLGNAITYVAHEISDYDRSVELERIGGEVAIR